MSRVGLVLSGLFILVAAYLIATQGLYGESFIALILGLPWVLFFAYFEFFGIENPQVVLVLTLLPMVINVGVLYWIGSRLEKMFTKG